MGLHDRSDRSSLDGTWTFTTDPTDVGVEERWFAPDATWPDARAVTVPHAWQQEDDLREYTGTGWYRRSVSLDAVPERAFLTFGAVDYEATVWVNGTRVGRHEGGYLPFAVEATDALAAGENAVVLRVFDPDDLSEIPHGKQGAPWYTRVSGPWQSVGLVGVPETYVEGVRATPDLADDTVELEVDVRGDGGDALHAVVTNADGESVARASTPLDEGTATLTLSVDQPEYWTPDSPTLYDVEVELRAGDRTLDTYADYFGMRSVEGRDGRLLLNGEELAVRGALEQGYYPDALYRPADLDAYEDEVRTAKDLGFNLLRKHIKPAHPRFLEHADRLGLLVWEEPANPSVYTETSRAAVRDQFEALVERDYNRPSVVAWGLYNEEWGIGDADGEESLWTDATKQDYLEAFYDAARDLDPTRPVCDNSGWAHVATDLNDYHEYFVVPDRVDAWRERLDEITDRPEDNYADARTGSADAWYERLYEVVAESAEDDAATRPGPADAPLLVSEFGTWGLPRASRFLEDGGTPHWFAHDFLGGLKRPAGFRERFEESPAAEVFGDLDAFADAWQRREFDSVEAAIADLREHDGVAGYVLTQFSDIEWEFNGVLDYDREPKAFAEAFARVNAPVMVHLDPVRHAHWAGDAVRADVVVANDTGDAFDATLEWSAFDASGTVEVSVAPHESARVTDAVAFEAPAVDGLASEPVALSGPEGEATRDVAVADADTSAHRDVRLHAEEPLAAPLRERGYDVVDRLEAADAAVVTSLTADRRSFAAEGGHVLLVPRADGSMAPTGEVSYETLPEAGGWNLCAGVLFQDALPELDAVPGWAVEGLYPYAYVDELTAGDAVSVGYAEGWMENVGAAVVSRPVGDGTLDVCTLRVTDAYGSHPVATTLVDRLLAD